MSYKLSLSALLLALLCLPFARCDDDPPEEETATFVLDVKAMLDDTPFVMGQTYSNAQDYQFNFETLRFYLSHLVLTKTDGSEVELKDVDFLNFENNHGTSQAKGEQVTGTVPAGSYTALRFAIGVDSTLNHDDPAAYPSSHPLSIYKGSHWNWSTGYIFVKMEGNVDTIPNGAGTLDGAFLYHTGIDTLYREVQFDDDFIIGTGETFEYKLKLDVNRIFYSATDTLNPATENFTHTTGAFELAQRVTELFAGAFSKR